MVTDTTHCLDPQVSNNTKELTQTETRAVSGPQEVFEDLRCFFAPSDRLKMLPDVLV